MDRGAVLDVARNPRPRRRRSNRQAASRGNLTRPGPLRRSALIHRAPGHDPIPAPVFDTWLDTPVALRGPDLLRVNGIVHIEGVPQPFVFHRVQHICTPSVPLQDRPQATPPAASSSSPATSPGPISPPASRCCACGPRRMKPPTA
ncbi:MAG: GTP-binding protein [Gemmobacter sp.]